MESANTSVAAVTDHEDGSCTVTVNGYGKTDIIATAADGSGVTASVTVNVSSLVSSIVITGSNKVAIGGKIKLKAEVFSKVCCKSGSSLGNEYDFKGFRK